MKLQIAGLLYTVQGIPSNRKQYMPHVSYYMYVDGNRKFCCFLKIHYNTLQGIPSNSHNFYFKK